MPKPLFISVISFKKTKLYVAEIITVTIPLYKQGSQETNHALSLPPFLPPGENCSNIQDELKTAVGRKSSLPSDTLPS